MDTILRFRPDSVPAIHPLPEYLASGQRAAWYEDTKQVLQVPWMGVVTMAYSHYPAFFGELWRGLKPLCASRPFVEAFQALRNDVEARVVELEPTSLVGPLADMGYAPREVDAIREMNTVFSHGNQLYVLIAATARHLLEFGDMSGGAEAEPYEGRHAPDTSIPLVLMEPHHVDEPTRKVYEDIKATLTLPFVNTDYRAFARWPSYFALAWSDLRGKVGKPAHEAICQAVHDRAAKLAADGLPNPGGLSAEALRRAASADAGLEEILQVCRLFQWLIPGLIVNVAYFRHQLEAVQGAKGRFHAATQDAKGDAMDDVKGLFFDVGGTVFDWKNTARDHIQQLADERGQSIDSEAFAIAWRGEMFKIHTQVRQGNLPWMTSDDMHLQALAHMAADYPLLNEIDNLALVKSTWHNLKPFAGAPEAIDRLRTKYTVVVLTILSWESIVCSSKSARVQWDGILSCEFLGYYKPSLQAYLKATRLLGLKPSEAMMVAAHEGDLAAARAAGLHTAFVNVPEEDHMAEGFEAPEVSSFDIEARDFDGLCRKLGV